jgi:hypothetical protein
MTRRRALFGLLLASVVLACFAGWLWMASGPRVSSARFGEVKKGMSLEEVISTVGAPPYEMPREEDRVGPYALIWTCDYDNSVLFVNFDSDRVATVTLGHWPPATLTDRIRSWLGL